MSQATYKERLVAGLLKIGWKQVQGRSHYTTFERSGTDRKMFVGTAGALRIGECASRSCSAQHTPLYRDLLAIGEKELSKASISEFTGVV